ncbi:MAG: hypothetical protein ACLFOY_00250 [Desulfatibacillaceae bacterium]
MLMKKRSIVVCNIQGRAGAAHRLCANLSVVCAVHLIGLNGL